MAPFYERYYNARDADTSWLSTYVAGSLLVLNPKFAEPYLNEDNQMVGVDLLYMCSLLIAELASLDANQPRGESELIPSTISLPPELLGRIIGSKRVSKEVAANLPISNESLTIAELRHWSRHPGVRYYDGVYYITGMKNDVGYEWCIAAQEPYTLEYISARDIPPGGNYREMDLEHSGSESIYGFSVYDYIAAYNARGMNGVRETINTLLDLLQEEGIHISEACIWTLILCSDLNEESNFRTMELRTDADLAEFCAELITKMLQKLRS